jgi:hypothetical protein
MENQLPNSKASVTRAVPQTSMWSIADQMTVNIVNIMNIAERMGQVN